MFLYFLLIRIAALFGHKKARLMVRGQKQTWALCQEWAAKHGTDKVLWVHAASVGEFEQARPLIERLKAEQTGWQVVLTFFSPSGYEMRKNYALADMVCYMPFATRRNAQRFIAAIAPTLAIFVKYEFWPAYLRELHAAKVSTYLISAIFRPNQYFFRWWGKAEKQLLTYFTKIFVQDQASFELLAKHDIFKVSVAGDTRFDRVNAIAQQAQTIPVVERFVQAQQDVFADALDKVIVAGSTWPEDERLLARYMAEHEHVKLVLVPHEIDKHHLDQIFQLFQGRLVRFSEATDLNIAHVRVLLVDKMGMLSAIYRYGQVAYVGGGFGVGIHNTIEPAVYGMPVLFGSNYHHFREAQGLIDAGAGVSVSNYVELENSLNNALVAHVRMGLCARDYVASELGATEHIMRSIFA